MTNHKWVVQVFGKKCSSSWEISVTRSDHKPMESWGWFGPTKFLVSHNGGPCTWPILAFVWDEQIKIANALCERLNNGETMLFTSPGA